MHAYLYCPVDIDKQAEDSRTEEGSTVWIGKGEIRWHKERNVDGGMAR